MGPTTAEDPAPPQTFDLQGAGSLTAGSGTLILAPSNLYLPSAFDLSGLTLSVNGQVFYSPGAVFTSVGSPGTYNFQLIAVPEPATWLLLAGGIFALATFARRIPARA